jgi:hypothetical protein
LVPLGNVDFINFAYDSDKDVREFAFYKVVDNPKKGRDQKHITLTRSYQEKGNPVENMFQEQIVLDDVLSFRCEQRLVEGTPRAMDCLLVVYVEDAPNEEKKLTHEFTIATLQKY